MAGGLRRPPACAPCPTARDVVIGRVRHVFTRVRRLCLVATIASVVVPGLPANAHAAIETEDLDIIVVEGQTSLGSWLAHPDLGPLVRSGAIALLSARTRRDAYDVEGARAAALATLGAGARLSGVSDPIDLPFTALGEGLAGAKVSLIPIPQLRLLLYPRVANNPRAVIRVSLERDLDRIARLLRRDRRTLLVGAVPDDARRQRGVWLGAIALIGPGTSASVLVGASTRRAGVVTLADVAPSVLATFDTAPLPSMTGRAWRVTTSGPSPADLLSFEDRLVRAHDQRRPLSRALMVIAMVALIASAILIRSARAPRVTRPLLAFVAAIPLALFLAPLLGARSTPAVVVSVVAVAAIGGAIVIAITPRHALAVIGALSALVVLIDLATGGSIAVRSPLSYAIASGVRFYGIGNELMGVVIGGTLASLTALRRDIDARMTVIIAVIAAVIVVLLVAPSVGAKFGASLTAAPAFATALVLARRARIDVRALALILAVTIVTALGALMVDRLSAPANRSHVGSATSSSMVGVLASKIRAAASTLALSIWVQTILAAAVAVMIVGAQRVWARAREHAYLRGAWTGGVVAVLTSVAFNDAGIIAAALIAVSLTPTLLLIQE